MSIALSRSYTVTDEVFSQRSMAAKSRANKQRLLKAVDAMCSKFRWHLDEKQRLCELAFYVTDTFDYEDMIQMYEERHHAALDDYRRKMEEAWLEEKSVMQSQIDELKRMLDAGRKAKEMEAHGCKAPKKKKHRGSGIAAANRKKDVKKKNAVACPQETSHAVKCHRHVSDSDSDSDW